jgi:hypothetical protein
VNCTPPALVPGPLLVIVVAVMVPWPILSPNPEFESIVEFSIVATVPESELIVAKPWFPVNVHRLIVNVAPVAWIATEVLPLKVLLLKVP